MQRAAPERPGLSGGGSRGGEFRLLTFGLGFDGYAQIAVDMRPAVPVSKPLPLEGIVRAPLPSPGRLGSLPTADRGRRPRSCPMPGAPPAVSFPEPAQMKSRPPPPSTTSLPPRAAITSPRGVPRIRSRPAVPTMSARCPKHLGAAWDPSAPVAWAPISPSVTAARRFLWSSPSPSFSGRRAVWPIQAVRSRRPARNGVAACPGL
jgi:hypothetical protein